VTTPARDLLPAERTAAIIRLRNTGLSFYSIARELDLGVHVVEYALRKKGHYRRDIVPHPDSFWTDAKLAEFMNLLKTTTLSYTLIAVKLGTTKSSVISKSKRVDLPDRPSGAAVTMPSGFAVSRAAAAQAGRKSAEVRRVAGNVPRPAPVNQVRNVVRLRAARIAPEAVGSVRPEQCKFPIGEPRQPGFRFCEEMGIGGRPYCPTHHKICYVPLPARADDPAHGS
jgi:GcrA cell cycle regulator